MRIVLLYSSTEVLYPRDVPDDTQISTVISLAKVEAGLSESTVIEIVHNGKVVINQNATLVEVGVHDGDIMQFRRLPVAQQSVGTESVPAIDFGAIKIPAARASTSAIRASAAGVSRSSGEETMEHRQLDNSICLAIINKFSGKSQIALLRNKNPSLADAIEKNDIGAVRDLIKPQLEEYHQKQKRLTAADTNPSPESQQIIEEVIQQRYESAMEHTPEAFCVVPMLYINVQLEGHDLKAFVDCGAQTTIVSKACAERCNIMRLVDKRFAGLAKGVGSQKRIERIPEAILKIAGKRFPIALAVLEDQAVDMLLGLDMMKRHLCNIDLKSNQLVFSTTGTVAPFLHERELPESAKLNQPLEALMDESAQLTAALQISAVESLKNSATSSSLSPGAVCDVITQQMEEYHQKRLSEACANTFSAESQRISEEVIQGERVVQMNPGHLAEIILKVIVAFTNKEVPVFKNLLFVEIMDNICGIRTVLMENHLEPNQHHNINSLYESAIDHTPETFGPVTMLYINARLEGHDVKVFVDCGAQTTILSKACAERCNILQYVDKRFAELAKGIGTQKTIGKIFMAQLQIEDLSFPVALTVLEDQSADLMLGLDILKQHDCNIDLNANQLVFSATGTATPFLHEDELPEFAKLNQSLEDFIDEDEQLAADESLAGSSSNSAESPRKAVKLDATGSALAQASGNSAASAASAAAPAASVSEENIEKLRAMGFKREDAVAVLLRSNGDIDHAIDELIARR